MVVRTISLTIEHFVKHNIESAQILALKKKGLVEEIEEVDGTISFAPHSEISLSGHQSTALAQIEEGFAAGKPTLLRGNRLWKNRDLYRAHQKGV